MGHPAIENKTGLAVEVLYLVDEELQPIIVPVVKGTFVVGAGGECVAAEEQLPLNFEGECNGEDPASSSYRYEPEIAFVKPTTDVVLIGHAHAPRRDTTQMEVGFTLGPVRKGLTVFGDRVWFRGAGGAVMSRPVPFEKMPLLYERAFGGWDRSHLDRARHTFEARNPVGRGWGGSLEVGIPVPNIEDPRALLRAFGERPAPAGFGFLSPNWQPRLQLAGTFDEQWAKTRTPLLPKDFDRRHHNAASPGLVTPTYLRGDEVGTVTGATPGGPWSFKLPGLPSPTARIASKNRPDVHLALNLDTVIVEPDDRRVLILWRAHAALRTGPHDVRSIEVSGARVSRKMSVPAFA